MGSSVASLASLPDRKHANEREAAGVGSRRRRRVAHQLRERRRGHWSSSLAWPFQAAHRISNIEYFDISIYRTYRYIEHIVISNISIYRIFRYDVQHDRPYIYSVRTTTRFGKKRVHFRVSPESRPHFTLSSRVVHTHMSILSHAACKYVSFDNKSSISSSCRTFLYFIILHSY